MSVRRIGASWWVDIRFNRDRYRKRSPDNTKAGAQAYEATIRQRVARGESILPKKQEKPESLTFEKFTQEWFETYVKANCKHSEILNKQGTLKLHLVPWFGNKELRDIQTLDIEQYKAEKNKKGLSPKTINNHLASLSKCLNCAYEWGRLKTAPPKIKKLKSNFHRIDFLSPVETWQLLQDHSEPTWNCMILVALRTGMRFGELLGLEWSDIDWERKQITVKQSFVRGVMGTPKSGKIRHIPMTDELCEALADRRKLHGLVFERPLGEFTHRVASNAIHRICKRTGVRKTCWHILRHTFASHLAMEGVPIPVVQQLLGHASIVMTMRYAHLSPSKLNEAVAVFERLEKREIEKFGQQVGNAVIKRTLSESPIIQQVAEKMSQ
ncbi:MAG: site-specific integrase [Desulfobulbaceae bacterium]|nr:site-specific integrase [Desulfobulbaceae bacterium]